MRWRLPGTLLFMLVLTSQLVGQELQFALGEVRLHGRHASQRLLVLDMQDGVCVGDQTERAAFRSANPAVATVDAAGHVRAVSDGQTAIAATVGNRTAEVTVVVTGAQGQAKASFVNDIEPVLTKLGCNSGACHGALAGKGGLKLSLRGYDPEGDHLVITRQAQGRRVDFANPVESLFLLKPTGKLPHGGGRRLDPAGEDAQLLHAWIAAGAPGPASTDPSITHLEVYPNLARLKPEEKLRLAVSAVYSDGRTRDVTPWAKFTSTDDLILGVDESGQITVKGQGEAGVSVWFGNQVGLVTVTVPFDHPAVTLPIGGDRVVPGVRHNLIDDAINAKLVALRLPMSPICTDEEFIRRVFLDTCGILPTPAETQRFVADPSPDKRGKLIDHLLNRPEFVDYWTYKWCDLFLVSSLKLSQQAVWAFHRFIRSHVAANTPWDELARTVLTANGPTLKNGAATYFLMHQDIAALTETTAVTFMGLSITCARCHNHPLEKWTQDQYWSMASLFSRVGLKTGEKGGEALVVPLAHGEVLHPRRGIAMPPTPLDGRPMASADPTDRRAYFAAWLTAPTNPYFARAIINRVWRNFMGRGLVEPEDDLRLSNPPSHPKLLTDLERYFVSRGYDLKDLMRLILNSAAYQRTSAALAGNAHDDRFYSRYLIRRLPAEVILDAYAQVVGVPTPFTQVAAGGTGGVAGIGDYPLGTRALQLPDTKVVSRFLRAFGRPERDVACACERENVATLGQALHVFNGQTLNDKLRDAKSIVARWETANVSDEAAINEIYLAALCRRPTPDERRRLLTAMQEARQGDTARREILEDLCWAVLTGKEFMFNR